NMKKDMGGAATMLALAHMLMARGTRLRLRVLIPAVENAISGAAFRPRDVYQSRKGLSVEIGNTDAEGRLILADAIALADEERPAGRRRVLGGACALCVAGGALWLSKRHGHQSSASERRRLPTITE